MKVCSIILLVFLTFLSVQSVTAQTPLPKGYFRSPLGIDLSVSGSFSEIRGNHFHSGVDFSVQQKIGLPVYAVADGVVSRIKVSPVGFGNALYIDHPNGFTSVYAHLAAYSDTITSYLREKQYRQKSFEVDLFPSNSKELIRVKKGQIIGYAGNSGSSEGAHLHFEIRDTHTERVINPLLFGFDVPDQLKPSISILSVYPGDRLSYAGNCCQDLRCGVQKVADGEYRLSQKDTLSLWGAFGFGVQAFDYQHNATDKNGFYTLTMMCDSKRFFTMICDSFAFDESRYVNATIDYSSNYSKGDRIVHSNVLPGNRLSFLYTEEGRGVVRFDDGKVHEIRILVSDINGNSSQLRFPVKAVKPAAFVEVPSDCHPDVVASFRYNTSNHYELNDLRVEIPAGCLYDNMEFRYHSESGKAGLFSDIHFLHEPQVPLHTRMKVSIRAEKVPARLHAKAVLVRVNAQGRRSNAGGGFENGWVTASVNLFGNYAIAVDTVAPSITPWAGNRKSKSCIKFTVGDNLSGIRLYRGEVNGNWVLVEWDPKNRMMTYNFDKMTPGGKNSFTLYLEDEKGNKSSKTVSFLAPGK
jgi:hypothetical protein